MKTLDERIAEIDQFIAQAQGKLQQAQQVGEQLTMRIVAAQGQKGLLVQMKQEAEAEAAAIVAAAEKQDESPSPENGSAS